MSGLNRSSIDVMGFLSRLMGRRRGPLAENEPDEEQETPRLPKPPPTPTTRQPKMPDPTPSASMPEISGGTAGTPSYGSQGGTPSTERLHNPTRPGR